MTHIDRYMAHRDEIRQSRVSYQVTPDILDDCRSISPLCDSQPMSPPVETKSTGCRMRDSPTHPSSWGQLIPIWACSLLRGAPRRTIQILQEMMDHRYHSHPRDSHCECTSDRMSALSWGYTWRTHHRYIRGSDHRAMSRVWHTSQLCIPCMYQGRFMDQVIKTCNSIFLTIIMLIEIKTCQTASLFFIPDKRYSIL
jgi:hypothetical protein